MGSVRLPPCCRVNGSAQSTTLDAPCRRPVWALVSSGSLVAIYLGSQESRSPFATPHLLDLPYWTTGNGSLAKYRQYVRSCCVHLGLRSWVATAERRARLPRYLEFQSSRSGLLQMIPDLKLHWEDGQAVRSFCRLRAGIIRLTHRRPPKSGLRPTMHFLWAESSKQPPACAV